MSKTDPIERALDRLGELRHSEASTAVVEEARVFLRNRSNLVVAKAAKVTRELRVAALVPDLVIAFNKFMADAPRMDKRCAAVTEIVGALYELDYDEPAPYLAGLKHVQLEASFGPRIDVAAELRGLSARGLLRTRYPDAMSEIVPILVDREPAARLGAVRALAANGGVAGALLLRLKVLTGDPEAEVLGECFAGLLSNSPDKSLSFVADYIDCQDSAIAEGAMLALGECRLTAAHEALREKWSRTVDRQTRKVLLISMASSKLDEAIAFLISLVKTENLRAAGDALEALAIYRRNGEVREAVRRVVVARQQVALIAQFNRDFESSSKG